MVIDLFGLSADEVRIKFPEVFQHLLTKAKPERDQNRNKIFREFWWVIGHPRPQFRRAVEGLSRYVVTIETMKHRIFGFLPIDVVPDSTLVTFATEDDCQFGVLGSRVHVVWALATGGRLGVGNDPRYNKSRCFETFPFPIATDAQQARIRALAEQLDAHRKRQQALHSGLTLTGMYNVLEKLRLSATLTAKDKTIHEQGLVSVLAQLHDELDAAVFDAYGWSDLAPALVGKPGGTTPYPDKPAAQAEAEEELLSRLVALNAERAAEEARGRVRWLRPEFQNPGGAQAAQGEMETGAETAIAAIAQKKLAWPKSLPEQVQALRGALVAAPGPLTTEQLARGFTRAQTKKVQELLETLVALGQVHRNHDGCYIFGG